MEQAKNAQPSAQPRGRRLTAEVLRKSVGTPLASSPTPLVMHEFRGREYMFIYYRTDREALEKVVPEPLEIPDDPIVRFEMMKMPDVTGLGDYTECGQAIPVLFDGEPGVYLHQMYVDSFDAIVSGREIHAFPKKLGWPKCFVDDNTLVGILDYGRDYKFRIANATMDYKYRELPVETALEELMEPTYMLKIQTGYDAHPSKCELCCAVTPASQVTVREAWTGGARLELFNHVKCPMGDLPVREVVKAEHIIADIVLGRPKTVFNYLD